MQETRDQEEFHVRNAKEIEGMSVVAITDGKKLGTADELIISPDELRLIGFVMKSGLFSQRELIVESEDIRSVGADVITVDGAEVARISDEAARNVTEARSSGRTIRGSKVVTESGTVVGAVTDFVLDEDSRRITSLILGGSLRGNTDAIPAARIISVGQDVIVVRDEDGPPSPR